MGRGTEGGDRAEARVRPGRGARGEGGGNAPAAEVACQAPPMPAPALEPPISPTQAFGLRAQPGQRGYRKVVPLAPRLVASSMGIASPTPAVGQPRESAFCFLEPSDTAPPGHPRAHANLPRVSCLQGLLRSVWPWPGPCQAAPLSLGLAACSFHPLQPLPSHSPATCGLHRSHCTGVWGLQGTGLSSTRAGPSWSRARRTIWVGRGPQTKVLWGSGLGRHSWGRVGEGREYFFLV